MLYAKSQEVTSTNHRVGKGGALEIKDKWKKRVKAVVPVAILLVFVALLQVITMPKFLYPGDNKAPRVAAASLLSTGSIGIDYSESKGLSSLLDVRGQYLFENIEKQKYFSKYGIGYTLFYLPPMLVEKIRNGIDDISRVSNSFILYLNSYQVILTIVITFYLYMLVSFYTASTLWRLGFVLLSIYTTFLWSYLRAPTLEIFLILGFIGLIYHAIAFIRYANSDCLQTRAGWLHLLAATIFGGVLMSMKLFYALTFGAVWLFAFIAASNDIPIFQRPFNNLRLYLRQYVVYLIIPSMVIIVILLAVYDYKFGSPFKTGYGQWLTEEGQPHDRFALEIFPITFRGYFLNEGNANVFIHYPLFLFAFLGFWRFFKANSVDFAFIAFVFITGALALSFFSAIGEWCYGPRYMLCFLIVGTLPFIETGKLIMTAIKSGFDLTASGIARMTFGVMGVLVLCVVLIWSFQMQVSMNSFKYDIFYYMKPFRDIKNDRVNEYFKARTFHRGIVQRDMLAHKEGIKMFYPLEVIKENEIHGINYQQAEALLNKQTKLNYYYIN